MLRSKKIYLAWTLTLAPSLVVSSLFANRYISSKEISLTLILPIVCFILLRNFQFPKIEKKSSLLISGIYGYYIIYNFANSIFLDSILYGILAIVCTLIGFNTYKTELEKLTKVSVIFGSLISIIGLIQFSGVDLSLWLINNKFASTLGHKNIMAQFLGLLILLQIICIPKKSFILTALYIQGCYFSLIHCRSALLGCFVAMLIYLYTQYKKSENTNYKLKNILLTLLFLVLIQTSVFIIAQGRIQTSNYTHSRTIKSRLLIWEASLKAIADNPLGNLEKVYDFEIMPYFKEVGFKKFNSKLLYLTPHNEILRLTFEYGIQFMLLLIVFIFMTLKQLKPKTNIGLIILVYFFVDGMFQSSFNNPMTFMLIFFAIGLYLNQDHIERIEFKNTNALLFPTSFIFLVIAFIKIDIGTLMNQTFPNETRLTNYCKISPNDWRICYRAARMHILNGEITAASKQLEGILERSPHNFLALQELASLNHTLGDHKLACEYNKNTNQYVEVPQSTEQMKIFCLK